MFSYDESHKTNKPKTKHIAISYVIQKGTGNMITTLTTEVMTCVPVTATYRIEKGKAIRISATFKEIPAETIARLLLGTFGQVLPKDFKPDNNSQFGRN